MWNYIPEEQSDFGYQIDRKPQPQSSSAQIGKPCMLALSYLQQFESPIKKATKEGNTISAAKGEKDVDRIW